MLKPYDIKQYYYYLETVLLDPMFIMTVKQIYSICIDFETHSQCFDFSAEKSKRRERVSKSIQSEQNCFTVIIISTRRVPVGGKASVCLICMKYRIIILIIIIKRLGEILLSYIAHTSHHARTHLYLYHKGKGVCG